MACGAGIIAFIGTCVSCCFDEGVLIFTEVLAECLDGSGFDGAMDGAGAHGPLVAILKVGDRFALDLILCSLSMTFSSH